MNSLSSKFALSPGNWRRRAVVQLALAGLTSLAASCKKKDPTALPTTRPAGEWKSKSPAELGLNPERLQSFARHVGGNGCVVRWGWMAYQWGFSVKPIDVASAGKPVVAHLLYRAIEMRLIPSLDSLVVDFEPRLNQINSRLSHKDAMITWRHLVQQTACYGSANLPGTAFDYNDLQMALFWRVLMFKVYRVRMETVNRKVLLKHLTRLIGLEDRPCFVRGGPLTSPGHLKISAQDFCRFGLLYSRGGRWRDSQAPILPEKWITAALHTPHPLTLPKACGVAETIPGETTYGGGIQQEENLGCYSNMWWINEVDGRGRRLFPDLPPDTYAAIGQGGTHLMAHMPASGLTVAWNRSNLPGGTQLTGAGKDNVNRALSMLMGASAS